MTEAEALERARAALRECGSEQEVIGLKSIRLSTATEWREFIGVDEPNKKDTWYVRFQLKLDEGIVQHPDDILISIDDHSGEATLHSQM